MSVGLYIQVYIYLYISFSVSVRIVEGACLVVLGGRDGAFYGFGDLQKLIAHFESGCKHYVGNALTNFIVLYIRVCAATGSVPWVVPRKTT